MTSPVEQLKRSALFRGVEAQALEALVAAMQPKRYPTSATIFKKGDPGDSLYVLTAGKIRIFTTDESHNPITLTYFEPVRVFGDFALLDQQPRSASAEAVEPVETLVLSRADFIAFLPRHPSVGLAMLRNLSDRVRYITHYLDQTNALIHQLSQGEYERAIQQIALSSDDQEIQTLISAFVQMVHRVRARDEQLRARN